MPNSGLEFDLVLTELQSFS